MSASVELVREAAFKLNHASAILRAASLESESLESARELWASAKVVEGISKAMKDLSGMPEDDSP